MYADSFPLCGREAIEYLVVQVEAAEESTGWIELKRQSGLGEIDLHDGGASIESSTNVRFSLIDQVGLEDVPWIVGNCRSRIEEAERKPRSPPA